MESESVALLPRASQHASGGEAARETGGAVDGSSHGGDGGEGGGGGGGELQSVRHNSSSLPPLIIPRPTVAQSSPLNVPVIEIQSGTPDTSSPANRLRSEQESARRQENDQVWLERRLPHSGSRHSLSKSLTQQQQKKKEAKRLKSSQLPAHGEVQHMEQSLLKLLNEFNSGELRAFDSAYSLEQMESVRDQQEALARKHFELGAQQDLHPLLSDEGLSMASDNMAQLISSLEKLSQAIGNLSCLDRMVDPGVNSSEMGLLGDTSAYQQQLGGRGEEAVTARGTAVHSRSESRSDVAITIPTQAQPGSKEDHSLV